jgi:TonB family protein
MRRLLALALTAAVAWPLAAAYAREPLRLQPSTPWVLDYAEENCRLARNFGEGDQRVTLVMDQFEPGDEFRMTLIGRPVWINQSSRPVEAKLRFGPTEAESRITALTGTAESKEPALIVQGALRLAPLTDSEEEAREQARRRNAPFEPAPIGAAREAAVNWLELIDGPRRDVVLETGPMDKPMAALRNCSWDTIKFWGLDVEQQKKLSRKPRPQRGPETWLSADDYPRSMVRGGYQGIVHFRLLIGADGMPTSCAIQRSTRPKEFDDAVCAAVMKRARFEPALDAGGKPVPSYWISSVYFRLAG